MKNADIVIWVAFAVLCLIGGWMLFWLPFPNRAQIEQINNQCMQVKPGVKLEDLTRLFGTPKHFKREGYEGYSFDAHKYSYEYSVLYT